MGPCRIVLVTFGTLGDLHPFIALALALKDLGAHTLLVTSAEYRERVEAAGLAFAPISPALADIERDLGSGRDEITRRAVAAPLFLFDKIVFPYLDRAYEQSLRLLPGADLVLVSSLSFAARIAAEHCGVPWVSIVLQPMMLLSADDPPIIHGARGLSLLLRRLGPRMAAPVLNVLKWVTAPLMAPVNRLRHKAGLELSRAHPLFDGQFGEFGPFAAIGLYSPMLGHARASGARRVLQAGFGWYDGASGEGGGLSEELRAFLDAGDPPIVFTLGSSMVHHPGRFYEQSVEAARILGRRAVLLHGEDTHGLPVARAEGHSKSVHWAAYARHSELFPRAAAIVHHGGIGTLAQALRGGRPQLIVPFFADQPDNAERARRLGVARVIRPNAYDAPCVAGQLSSLMSEPRFSARAAEVASIVCGEDGAACAAKEVMRSLAETRARRPSVTTGAGSAR